MRDPKEPFDLVYVGTFKDICMYAMYIERALAFQVAVDTKDPDLKLTIVGNPDAEGKRPIMLTNGTTRIGLYSRQIGPTEADVEVYERVQSTPIRAYITLTLPIILFRLYCPTTTKDGKPITPGDVNSAAIQHIKMLSTE